LRLIAGQIVVVSHARGHFDPWIDGLGLVGG